MSPKNLNKANFDSSLIKKITKEKYSTQKIINDVKIITLNQIPTEDGYFLELFRLGKDYSLELFPNFKLQQVSYSVLEPGSIKAWHTHLFQDDIWFVPPDKRLLVGLYDIRENSKTKGNVMRIVLGVNTSTLLYIPRGVAHGCSNFSAASISLIYMTNKLFKITDPDEYRLAWDYLGKDFWDAKKG